jgi:hypothetical protein
MKNMRIINSLAILVGLAILPAAANAASLLEIYQQALQSRAIRKSTRPRHVVSLPSRPSHRRGALICRNSP